VNAAAAAAVLPLLVGAIAATSPTPDADTTNADTTNAARSGTVAASAVAEPTGSWQPIVPGADRATLTSSGGAEILLLRFDLERFRAEVVVGKGSPPQRRTAADLRHGRGAVAAVNGGFFDERVVPLGLRIASGEARFGLRSKADWGVLVLAGRRARIVHTRDYPPPLPLVPASLGAPAGASHEGGPGSVSETVGPAGAGADSAAGMGPGPTAAPVAPVIDGAIQVGPRLLVEGKPVKLRAQLARRTAVALDHDGRLLTLIVSAEPIEAGDLAAHLTAFGGFDSALFLDGGPSTQLSLELGTARAEIPGGYPVPDLLAIFARPPPHRTGAALRAPPVPSRREAPRP
jgi:uncharacterized protein YigE (DUF2233 family)